jgi:hypothetical protein
MTTPRQCVCPGPGPCPVFGRQMSPRERHICSGVFPAGVKPLSAHTCALYRRKWAGRPRPAAAPAGVPLPTLADVPCAYRGDVVSECSGCGGKKPERHTYRCDHPGADWDLCVPVPRVDVGFVGEVRACRRCDLRPTPAGG